MVPVRLELQNFLSYGTSAPPLEFDDFEVACLSGRNGQGKSALLDAMTWAVWGEARKSSGKRKPDDELIRIGARHMEVTFTFDLEGTRYRVQRTFSRSATGKTTTSGLEFQLYEPGSDAYRPLTGATQRDTQATIESTVGLDYDTFINSAFLLQGRSDEFTKKSPSQRKEILVSILNLSRYERLERKARDAWRAAKQAMQRAEREVERLQQALDGVEAWREKKAEVEASIEAQQQTLETLREEETALAERKADLDAKAREVEQLTDTEAELTERIERLREERATLEERIEDAEALLSQRDAIQAEYERYEALQEERNDLDELRDLHRGIEKQIEQKEAALRDRRSELEKTLDRLTVEKKGFEQTLQEITGKLAQRPSLVENLKSAQAAQQRADAMAAVRRQRDALKEQLTSVEQSLVGARQQLQGELDALQAQIEQQAAALAKRGDLERRRDALTQKMNTRAALRESLQETEARGTSLTETIRETTGEAQARREALQDRREQLQRFASGDGPSEGRCPTCGTALTAEHREEVAASLREEIHTLEASVEEVEASAEAARERRDALREEYRTLHARLKALEDVPEQRATVREQLRALDEQQRQYQANRQQAATLRRRLQQKAYGEADRARRRTLRQRLSDLSFDANAYEQAQNEAAQVDRYKERLRDLEALRGRKGELERKRDQHAAKIDEIRQALDAGTAFGALPKRIQQLKVQLKQIGFDPDRFRAVRRRLNELKDASARMKDLVNAQRNRDDWRDQHARLGTRVEAAEEKREALREHRAALREALQETDELEQKQAEKAKAVRAAEAELNEKQQTLGQLRERLDQAKRDRAALQEAKQSRDDAKKQRTLYKHLRAAFGKNGIPSLIIEETLPEIEERANVILDRLTDGKMHVRLETLKDKKTGGTKETLEIIITDEQGMPRPYETFSGGESFRVNFALRIALAQLLAERSGVRVRTLVIDEGFGTQDEQGIERLVESIQTIREDFAKILVITHLQRLKQAFPVRIEVQKDPVTGSTFDVVGA